MDLRVMAAVASSEKVNISALCREFEVSRKTFYKWRDRYLKEGLAGLEERSRRPHSSPRQVDGDVEDRIVELRKDLEGLGLDHGAETIQWHLERELAAVPSVATIWRILVRRGQVTPAPSKRPKSSWCRFEAAQPNELWQIDATEWALVSGQVVEIINILDDHSRLSIASQVVEHTTTVAAWKTFSAATQQWGLPTGCLSDNGLAFSGRLRGVEVVFETNLRAAGIQPITSRPYHPQTCGKVERFQQTLKKWLRKHGPFETLEALQHSCDEFRDNYNYHRPHRSIGRIPPHQRWAGAPKACPDGTTVPTPRRRSQVTVDLNGVARTRPYDIGLGVEYAGLIAEIILEAGHANVYIHGQLIRHLELDPNHRYQPTGRKRGGTRKPRLA